MLGNQVELLSTLERRLELLAECGVEDVLVVEFTPETAALDPTAFAQRYLLAIGAEVVVAGEGFRFGRQRAGDLDLLRSLGLDAREVPLVEGISSSRIRQLAHAGEVGEAALLLGRPLEVDGTVVWGDQRGGTLGFPTANLQVEPDLLVPPSGSTPARSGTCARRSRSASTRTTAARSGASRRTCSTGRATSTATGSWSRSGSGSATSVRSRARTALIAQIAEDVEQARAAVRPGT